MKVVVDNVAVLGIEFSLLERLGGLLSSDVVMNLDDLVVQEIATEKADSRIERARALSKLQSLEAGLYTLRRLGRHKLEGESVIPTMLHETLISLQFRISTSSLRSTGKRPVLRILM